MKTKTLYFKVSNRTIKVKFHSFGGRYFYPCRMSMPKIIKFK
jgi:hypothetical protein